MGDILKIKGYHATKIENYEDIIENEASSVASSFARVPGTFAD